MQNMEKNLTAIHARIAVAAEAAGRDPQAITLLAVSKKKPASDIREAYRLGQSEFGENYLQEALQKMQELDDLQIQWHFIGAIQSNKTRSIAEAFDWAHCIDRLKIAQRLSDQVNLDHESSKAGIDLAGVPELAQAIANLPGVRLRGLMAIPAPRQDFAGQRQAFAGLAAALVDLQQRGIDCDTLSMGMTQDMEAAIAEGSTLLRIGTAIFGERT
jgi:hypothetical protein